MARTTRKIHVACSIDSRGKKRCQSYCPLTPILRHGALITGFKGGVFKMVKLPIGAQGKYGKITKYTSDWARIRYQLIKSCGKLENARESGHEYEGSVRLGGRRHSAFTSGEGAGMIIVRTKS